MDLPVTTTPGAFYRSGIKQKSFCAFSDSVLTAAQRGCTIIIPVFQMKKERHNQVACLGTEVGGRPTSV